MEMLFNLVLGGLLSAAGKVGQEKARSHGRDDQGPYPTAESL